MQKCFMITISLQFKKKKKKKFCLFINKFENLAKVSNLLPSNQLIDDKC